MPRRSFARVLVLCAAVSLYFPNQSSHADRPTPRPSPLATPTAASLDTRCELHSVNNLIVECCSRVGGYYPGFSNCTDYRKSFDTLCGTFTNRRNCRSVSVWCPHGSGHAMNLIRLSDGMWYLVEPQGWVYEDYPLPSPEIPDSLMSQVMPGCGCEFRVDDFAPAPNTDPLQCSGNDFALLYNQKGDVRAKCEECCRNQPSPPAHPNPARFQEMCLSGCNRDELVAPRETYCSKNYRGRACESCCALLNPASRESCASACEPGGDWGDMPIEERDSCSKTASTKEECLRCCDHTRGQCAYRWSLSCTGWGIDCAVDCSMRFPSTPTPEATPTVPATRTTTASR
jgi:hypothetical protein